jgi:guanylate kinase
MAQIPSVASAQAGSGRLVILSGPSCVGKSPLDRALAQHYPELRRRLQPICLYNSRDPRPGEIDGVHYHFRRRAQIEALGADPRHVVLDVRGDLQALDLDELSSRLGTGDVFFEGNPFVGRELQTHPGLGSTPRLSVFMAPLSREEIVLLRAPERQIALRDLVTDVMRRKLLRRTRRQKGELGLRDLENIERRAASAYDELRFACHFTHVLPNHDGEDSENWNAFPVPLGDAGKTLAAFVALLEGRPPAGAEVWEPELLP